MTDTRTASARRPASTPPGGRPGKAGERPDKATAGSWPVRERSLIKPVLGIPPLVAVAIAVGLTALGVFVDLLRLGTVGSIFEIGYFLGCLLAVAWVRRRGIFVAAIQPPLLLAVVVPVLAVLIGAPTPGAGATEHLLMAGAPLINAFPAMAVTTAAVLAVAGFRLVRQRTGPDDAVGQIRRRLPGGRAADDGSGPGAGDPSDAPARERAGAARERKRPGPATEQARRAPAPRATGRSRTGADRTSGDRAAPATARTASDRTGPDRTGSGRTGPNRTASGRTGPGGTTDSAAQTPSTPRGGSPRSSSTRSTGSTGSTPRGSARAEEPAARPRRPRRT